jgi:C1A family cysteine protease
MQVIVGYVASLDVFIVRNTWGDSFGDEGYALIASSFVDRIARDIWVIQAAPEVY